jgi:hypothetical protein
MFGLAAVMLLVTATVAVNRETSWEWVVQWGKMALIFPLLVVGVVRTRATFNLFVIANMLGSAWWGWNAYTNPKREAGRLVDIGSGDSLDDNGAAAHLLTVLPFALILLLTEKKDKRLRAVALAAVPLVINTLILCNSRGAMVGVVAAMAAAILLVRTGYRGRLIGVGAATVVVFFALADQQFIDRQQTTTNYEDDGSATQRLMTWTGAANLVMDRPLGAGGRGFHLLSPVYIPDVVSLHGGDLRAPHNTYAMVASEWGILGLICYLGFYGSAFRLCQKVKEKSRTEALSFYYWRALAIQLGIIAFMVASVFSDRLYAEAGYWLIALGTALYRIHATETASAESMATVAEPAPATGWSPSLDFAGAQPRG